MALNPAWPQGLVENLLASEDEVGFLDMDDLEDDDDGEDDDDWDADLEPIADELPGLLQDAEMDLMDVTQHQAENAS